MAAKEPYDYLSTVSADVDVTLNLTPHQVIVEEPDFIQEIKLGDDGSEKRIGFSSTSIWYVEVPYKRLRASDAGTLLDLWADTAKAQGRLNSFKLDYGDGHTYVVRFDSNVRRELQTAGWFGFGTIRMRMLGKIVDS